MMDLLYYPHCSERYISNYDLHHFAIPRNLVLWYLVFLPFLLSDPTLSFQWLVCYVKVSGNIKLFSWCRFGFLLVGFLFFYFTYFVAVLLNRIFVIDFSLNCLILAHFPYATRKVGLKVLCLCVCVCVCVCVPLCVCVCNCHSLTDNMKRQNFLPVSEMETTLVGPVDCLY
jgi:hypothetical protein